MDSTPTPRKDDVDLDDDFDQDSEPPGNGIGQPYSDAGPGAVVENDDQDADPPGNGIGQPWSDIDDS